MSGNYWMVRTHTNPAAFAENGLVALGWKEVNIIDNDLKTIKGLFLEKYSTEISGKNLGEIRRFKEIKKGDTVVVPCPRGFYVGISTGIYRYDDSNNDDHKNQLKVDFIKGESAKPIFFERKGKNTALQTKLACRFTTLQIKEKSIINELEFLKEGKRDKSSASYIIEEENKKLEEFRTNLEKSLPDYKGQSIDAHGLGMEEIIKTLFELDGFKAQILSKKTGGSGIADADVFAIKESIISPELNTACFIQVKHHQGYTGETAVEQIVAYKKKILKDAEDEGVVKIKDKTFNIGVFCFICVTTAKFDARSKEIAEDNNILLIDGDELSGILYDKIDQMDDLRYNLGFIKTYEKIDNNSNKTAE